jgi:hypothetical protein
MEGRVMTYAIFEVAILYRKLFNMINTYDDFSFVGLATFSERKKMVSLALASLPF